MNQPAVEIQALSKRYVISHQARPRHRTLRDEIVRVASAPLQGRRVSRAADEEFWALRDVSFVVDPGDVVGIIGRNGSGKSTLLKILSRIVDPTEGQAILRGKTASLLEVGTGFHPELTGRENIYFNGSILGMSRRHIDRQFDQIVAFAETEKFLDTPVKFYSSGMFVRLAFAIAAHLDPDILIVDEVLAVGDGAFQKKCLSRMSEVAHEGKTVLFVSHNMHAIQQLCTTAVYLRDGRLISQGATGAVMHDYLYGENGSISPSVWKNTDGLGHPKFTAERFAVLGSDGEVLVTSTPADATVEVEVTGSIEVADPLLTIGYAIYDEGGDCLYWSYHTDQDPSRWPRLTPGPFTLRSAIPPNLLNEGVYRLELIASLHFRQWLLQPNLNAPSITLTVAGGMSTSPYFQAKRPTTIAPVLTWIQV